MKSLIIILAGLYVAWRCTDVTSGNFLANTVCPVLVLSFLVALAVWLVMKADFGEKSGDIGGDGGGFGGSDGGDGGC